MLLERVHCILIVALHDKKRSHIASDYDILSALLCSAVKRFIQEELIVLTHGGRFSPLERVSWLPLCDIAFGEVAFSNMLTSDQSLEMKRGSRKNDLHLI